MENTTAYLSALSKTAWAYAFLFFTVSVSIGSGTLVLPPRWAAFLLFFLALPALQEQSASFRFLKPVAAVLGIREAFLWLLRLFFEISSPLSLIGLMFTVLELYFSFQLLTLLADAAQNRGFFDCAKKLLRLRTVNLIFSSFLSICSFLFPMSRLNGPAGIVLVLFSVTISFLLVTAVFGYRAEELRSEK